MSHRILGTLFARLRTTALSASFTQPLRMGLVRPILAPRLIRAYSAPSSGAGRRSDPSTSSTAGASRRPENSAFDYNMRMRQLIEEREFQKFWGVLDEMKSKGVFCCC
jgi:pentatricopeptide repeat protein